MDLTDIDLQTDLGSVLGLLDGPAPAPRFALPLSQFQKFKADDKAQRRGIKALIQPENAQSVVPHLPERGERTHCALCGDFVLGDIIPAIIRAKGRCPELLIATLGMSTANADMLLKLKALDQVGDITIVCSHYFAGVSQGKEFREVAARLKGIAEMVVARCHAKVICLPTDSGDHYVLEGSANLRSSDNTEQLVIFNDTQLMWWHHAWLGQLSSYG